MTQQFTILDSFAINALCIALAACCWAFCSLYMFGKLKDGEGFWQSGSWLRKYKRDKFIGLIPAPKNWYYKTFKIDYKERFPLSATTLVFLTDGFHLSQWFMIKLLMIAVASTWLQFFILWGVWVVFWNLIFTVANGRK